MDKVMAAINEFHKHLDECSQCENHPFNLCPKGADLIKKPVEASTYIRQAPIPPVTPPA